MTARARGALHLVVALVVGCGAALAVGLSLDGWRASRAPDDVPALMTAPNDRVEEAVAALLEDGVHVPPDGRGLISEQGERAVEEAVAAAEVPVFVIVWPAGQDLGAWSLDLTDRVVAGLGVDRGSLLVWSGAEQGESEVFGGRTFARASTSDFVGDPGTTLPPLVTALGDPEEWYEVGEDEFDYWGGVGGGIAAGLLFAGGGLLALLTLGWVVRLVRGRRLLPGRWLWRE